MEQTTHILLIFKSQNSEMLFRADDGICIGQRKNETVIYGDEPNKRSSHVFIDGVKAGAWLEAYASEDLKKRGETGIASVEHRDGEPIIQLAPDSIDLPKYGANPLRN